VVELLARGGRALARGGREQGQARAAWSRARAASRGRLARRGAGRGRATQARVRREPLITIPHKQARGDPHVGADPLARCREN